MTSAVREARESSLRDLDRELAEIARTYPAKVVVRTVKYLGNLGLRRIVRRTAVGPNVGGRTKGNWQVTIGTPAEGVLDTVDPSGGATITAGSATIDSLKSDGRTFPALWITNNMPGILELEEGGYPPNPVKGTYIRERTTRRGRVIKGHYEIRSAGGYSKRSPRGMVAVTVEELLQSFNRVEASL